MRLSHAAASLAKACLACLRDPGHPFPEIIMPSPLQNSLGIVLVLALGACAEMKVGVPSKSAEGEPGACAADAHQDWVGKRVDVLNDVDLPEGARVLFPTTPATMDYREDRLNVSVDKADRITRVFCG